jgi:hypothetical protein
MTTLIWIALVLLITAVVFHTLIARAWIKANAGGAFRMALILFFLSLALAFAIPVLLVSIRFIPDARSSLESYGNIILAIRFLVLVFHDVALIFLYLQVYKHRN